MAIYNKDIEKQKEVLVEGILRKTSLPIIIMNMSKGIIMVAPNPTNHIKKIRYVYPGIMFGAMGDMPIIDMFHEALVHRAHHIEMDYGDPEIVSLNRLKGPAQQQILMNYSDIRLRPFLINFVLAQKNTAFIIDYTGSIEEVEENAFGIIGTKSISDKRGQKQILTEILEQKLKTGKTLADLSPEQGISICKKALTEAGFKAKFFEVGILQKNGETSIKKQEN